MLKQLCVFLTVLLLAVCHSIANTEEVRVETPAALQSAVKSAQPGDVIKIVGADWSDVKIKLILKGTKEKPITVQSQIAFTGASELNLLGEYVVLDGFTFRNGSLKTGHVFRVRGAHNRVTRCTIEGYNPERIDVRYQWLSLYGHHHRVDHCRFAGQNHSGTTLVVWLDDDGEVGRHRIERNHFLNRPQGKGNGFETLRIGTSETSMKSARCVVAENLFENCDGEVELISNKSCDNIYERNTIVGCAGALTLRHGNNCIVRENLILGDGDRHSGGIRVVGEGHQIIGNHIEGVADRIDGAIALSAGVPNPKLNQHAQVQNVLIEGNTLIDNAGEEIVKGHGLGSRSRTLLPVNITIKNTRRTGKTLLKQLKSADVGPDAFTK
ncbi:Chondroitinase-B precursor [Gimesia maris]|uniref:polysaccharide lyase 6 family protein n=1 Tax=Gimesia maris TaxID=122 RepID=UPI00118CE1E1|nr:polysaccharide lyase 6 family protein [Gimesia maris]QDT80193.1 Chondroitinase-B precursor [Gimesia maris]